jgi:hypothetical protein
LESFILSLQHKSYLSPPYHPQTDGQTEVVNKSIETCLRHVGAENHDDRDKLLVFAEFANNNSKHSSTGFTPFRLNCGFDSALPTSFSVFKDQHPLVAIKKGTKCPGVDEFFKRIQQAIVDARENIEVAQQQQKYYADLKRRADEVF